MKKPVFEEIEIVIPTKEQLTSKEKTKFTRHPYEWAVENKVLFYFNITQQRAKQAQLYIDNQLKKITVLAVTSTVISIAILLFTIFR